MRHTRSIIALLLALLMMTALFAGCGSNGSSASDEGTSAQTSAAAPAESSDSGETSEVPEETEAVEEASYFPLEETAELSMWGTLPNDLTAYMETFNDTVVWQKIEELTNVHIDMTLALASTSTDAFNIMVSSGEYPDLIQGMAARYPGGLTRAYDDGIIVELTDLINDYMPDYKALVESDERYVKDTKSDDGETFGIYILGSFEDNSNRSGLVIRGDWLDALNLEVPTTYDEMYEVLKAFQAEYNTDSTLWIPFMGVSAHNILISGYQVGGPTLGTAFDTFYQVDGTVHFGAIEEGYREYLEMLQQWYSEGLVYKDFMSDKSSFVFPIDELVLNNRTGVWQSRVSWIDKCANHEDASYEPLPIAELVKNEGDEIHLMYPNLTANTQYAVSSTCEDLELACRWMNFWSTEEGIMLANYGIEGQSYELVDGEPVFTDLILNNPDGMSVDIALNVYATGGAAPTINYGERTESTYSDNQKKAAEVWSTMGDSEWFYPYFATMTADENTEFTSMYTDMTTLISEFMLKAITGEVNLDSDWDEYVATLEGMGSARVIELKQAALERYNNR